MIVLQTFCEYSLPYILRLKDTREFKQIQISVKDLKFKNRFCAKKFQLNLIECFSLSIAPASNTVQFFYEKGKKNVPSCLW